MYVLIDMILCQYPMDQWPTWFEEIKKRVGSEDVFWGHRRSSYWWIWSGAATLVPRDWLEFAQTNRISRNTPDGRGYEIYHLLNESKYVGVPQRRPLRASLF